MDPAQGSGGVFLGTPRAADIQSGRSVFDAAKFDSLVVGRTSKRDVVAALGKPAWWQTRPDGTSSLGYDFVGSRDNPLQKIERATFDFGADFVLSKKSYTGH